MNGILGKDGTINVNRVPRRKDVVYGVELVYQ
jgi:hypothetical protein